MNLGFETANLPVIPAGEYGGLVSTTDAIPGWTAYYGTNQTLEILQNSYSLGAVNISILGPDWYNSEILQGRYTVLLQSGLVLSTTPTPAIIAQTGTIPADALSVQFLTRPSLGFPAQPELSVGGQSLSLVPLSTTPSYTLYGADISAFSGLNTELRIGSFPDATSPYHGILIDSISFSSMPVPEPDTFALLGLGGLLLGWRFWRERKGP